jgi:predicted nuclease of restriction endonuclease-like (RecB) superfamily
MASQRKRSAPALQRRSDVRDAPGYGELLADLKSRIHAAQLRAAIAANREMISLYWDIGRTISERQDREGWGASIIEQLGRDLRAAFPGVQGFSSRNLWRMRALYRAYAQSVNSATAVAELGDADSPGSTTDARMEFPPQLVAQIPWGHNIVLLEKIDDSTERLWYARKTVEHGWSRNVLVHQIESGLYRRQGKALTNFARTLPAVQSELAAALLKDPYHFDFLQLGPAVEERELEKALVAHVRDFLLELGVGFALVGSQYRLEVGGQDYRIDLLFFHIHLRCFVVVELKIGAFQPEYAGKMSFYLSAVDEQLRGEEHQPSIGLILCKERNRVVVEYALRGMSQPIGVAEYRVTEELPQRLRGKLPTVEELEKELSRTGSGDLRPPDPIPDR